MYNHLPELKLKRIQNNKNVTQSEVFWTRMLKPHVFAANLHLTIRALDFPIHGWRDVCGYLTYTYIISTRSHPSPYSSPFKFMVHGHTGTLGFHT